MEGAGGMEKQGEGIETALGCDAGQARFIWTGQLVSETYEYGCEIIPVCAVTTSAADNRRRWAGGMNERQTRQWLGATILHLRRCNFDRGQGESERERQRQTNREIERGMVGRTGHVLLLRPASDTGK